MLDAKDRQKILGLFQRSPTGVVATVNLQGKPEAAVVLFTETDNLEVIFSTHASRKYRNLQANPSVAMTVHDGLVTVQYEGVARELTGEEIGQFDTLYLREHPYAVEHLKGSRLFMVTPTWVRYSDYGQRPPYIVEGPVRSAEEDDKNSVW